MFTDVKEYDLTLSLFSSSCIRVASFLLSALPVASRCTH